MLENQIRENNYYAHEVTNGHITMCKHVGTDD